MVFALDSLFLLLLSMLCAFLLSFDSLDRLHSLIHCQYLDSLNLSELCRVQDTGEFLICNFSFSIPWIEDELTYIETLY